MKSKINLEPKKMDQTFPDKTSEKSGHGTQTVVEELPMATLARLLSILELRDDHSVDKSFAKNVQTQKELESLPQKAESKFLGILAKCKIQGCDVHALDSNLNIISHFRSHEKIDECFEKARALAGTLPDTIIAILVYSDHLSYLYSNGKLEVCHA